MVRFRDSASQNRTQQSLARGMLDMGSLGPDRRITPSKSRTLIRITTIWLNESRPAFRHFLHVRISVAVYHTVEVTFRFFPRSVRIWSHTRSKSSLRPSNWLYRE